MIKPIKLSLGIQLFQNADQELKKDCLVKVHFIGPLKVPLNFKIGSGNGLFSHGTKPSPQQLVTYYPWDPQVFTWGQSLNTLTARQNGCHFADNIFKCIFLNENAWISIKISLKYVPKGPINNIPSLLQIMAWHRPGDKPLSEPMMVKLPTHICVTQPQWFKTCSTHQSLFFLTIH